MRGFPGPFMDGMEEEMDLDEEALYPATTERELVMFRDFDASGRPLSIAPVSDGSESQSGTPPHPILIPNQRARSRGSSTPRTARRRRQ